MNAIIAIVGLFVFVWPAVAQDTQFDKTEVFVENRRAETVTMQFAIGFEKMSWTLITLQVPPGDDVTYRFPVSLPYCDSLEKLGIQGIATIALPTGVICQKGIRLCTPTKWQSDVKDSCKWTENVLFRP